VAYRLARTAPALLFALGPLLAMAAVQDFGQVAVNGSPASLTLTYTFTGLAAAPSFSLAWNRDFQMNAPTCTVAATTNCSIAVTFNPLRPGLRQDSLTVKDQSGNVLARTPLRGTGMSPLLALYPGVISTLAGNGIGGYQNSPNPASAEFWNPQGIALDGSANAVYVADSINGSIRKIVLSTGVVTTVAGNGTDGYSGDSGLATGATLNAPTGIAIDGAGNLYIADQGNNLIRRVDAITQIITTVAGGGTTPSGADTYGDGGPATSAILDGPQSVAVDSSGNVYIADTYHQLIRMVNAATGIISVVAGGGTATGTDGFGDGLAATSVALGNPSGVALDSAGNLYFADTGNNLIRRVDASSGIISAVAGNGSWGYSGDGGLATSANLASPQSVALDAGNNIYIADLGNNAIRLVSAASHAISTVAGRGSTGYAGDGGNPTLAFLTSPMGLAVDENGNLYIGDTGNNVVRAVSIAAAPLSFASEPIGAITLLQAVTPVNIGNQPLAISAISFSSDFQQVSTGLSDCAPGTALAPGSSCNAGVSFAPVHTGAISGSMVFTSNSLNNAASQETVNLSGIGLTAVGPQASLSTATLTFSAQTVYTASAAQTITLTNSGGSPFAIYSIGLAGAQASDFQITTSCGSALAAAESCSILVIFAPTAGGTRSATVTITDSVVGTPQSVALSGTGIAGTAGLSAASLNFNASVGLTSSAQSVSLANTGSVPLQILSVTLSGSNSGEFQLSTGCGSSVSAGASCSFSVTFSPAAAGSRSATLSIFDNATGSPQTVTLNGTATVVIPSNGLRFIPITPCRIADTRTATGPFGGPILSQGVTRSFPVPSSPCAIPAEAQAYSLNFTVVPATWLGFMTVWPTGLPLPIASLLNSDGRVKANAAILPAGTGGAISVYASQDTHVIIDINGYFVPATNLNALGFYPLTPCRIADTRLTSAPLQGWVSRNFSPLTSSCPIPPSAQAYSLNMTAIPIAAIGYLTTWPAGLPQPLASTLNTSTLEVTANAAIVPAGTNGEVTVLSSDPTHLVIDIDGYFAPAIASGALSLFSVTPCRALDTRLTSGPISGTVAIPIAGSACQVSTTAQAYVLNATVVPTTSLGFLSLWQDGAPFPLSSLLNADDRAVTSNMGIIPTTNGSVDTMPSSGTQLIIDISAYFAP